MCHIFAAWTLWSLGYPDQGLTRNEEAVTLAQQMAHPFSLSFALSLAAIFHQFRREVRAAQERAEAAMQPRHRNRDFPYWMAVGAILRGWALAHQGQAQEGIEQITPGLDEPIVPQEQSYYDRIIWRSSLRHMGPWSSQRQDSRCSRKR